MHRVRTRMTIAALILGAAWVTSASAQSSGGQYRIDPVALPGGGGPTAGGNYQITSSMGLPATGILRGVGYVIFGGFWSPVGGFSGEFIFANGFESN